jgi:threonine aldolase
LRPRGSGSSGDPLLCRRLGSPLLARGAPLYIEGERTHSAHKELSGNAGYGDMTRHAERYEFASDNTTAICPEAFAALQEANVNGAPSYGDDHWTARVRERVREIFETDCAVYFVFNGTAANALVLAQLCQSFHSIICHKTAHIQTDECGAPEFFTKGSKLLTVAGANGKIGMEEVAEVIARQPELHAHKPHVISIAQSTELGTVYTREELAVIGEFARSQKMLVHMDGARFANAIAALNCAPKEITWEVNVDVLCFGGTKNGLAAGELVIFFKKELACEFDYRLKQAGQLGSKMRFLAAPWLRLLTEGVWLRNARHANQTARRLAEGLRNEAKIHVVFPVEANAVFVRISEQLGRDLQVHGWQFYKFIEPDIYRLMCSWSTTAADVDAFIGDVGCVRRKSSL